MHGYSDKISDEMFNTCGTTISLDETSMDGLS